MNPADDLRKRIDDVVAQNQHSSGRGHLGWSMIGRQCVRQVWYGFRWAKTVRHTGRLLRLFQRGHDEEDRVIKWLRDAGCVVYSRDPETGNQFQRLRFGDHFGGSADGKISNIPGLDGEGLLEIKTHGDKSFNALQAKGVFSAKPEHYIQMQGYMADHNLPWALYFSVNKNDDTIYLEIVNSRPELAEMYLDRAKEIIVAQSPPPRISQDPTWFVCKFCDFREICHKGEKPAKNCRTCVNFSANIEDGGWFCSHWHATPPDAVTRVGCDSWVPFE